MNAHRWAIRLTHEVDPRVAEDIHFVYGKVMAQLKPLLERVSVDGWRIGPDYAWFPKSVGRPGRFLQVRPSSPNYQGNDMCISIQCLRFWPFFLLRQHSTLTAEIRSIFESQSTFSYPTQPRSAPAHRTANHRAHYLFATSTHISGNRNSTRLLASLCTNTDPGQ